MNGWTPADVMRLPRGVHARLVALLLQDQERDKAPSGFSMTEGYRDR
jgi:hypothetical protein